jgi:hypothetical protein
MSRASEVPQIQLVIPELRTLRELRRSLAHGGLPAIDKRTPEDWARLAAHRSIAELCRILGEYRRRVESGEHVRLVERELPPEPGRMRIELLIEVVP